MKPASSYLRISSRYGSGSGPAGVDSATSATMTFAADSSKLRGAGSSWPPEPASARFGHSLCALVARLLVFVVGDVDHPELRLPLPPAASNSSTTSLGFRRREIDLGLLLGHGVEARTLHRVVVATVRDLLPRPQLADHVHGLLEHLEPLPLQGASARPVRVR